MNMKQMMTAVLLTLGLSAQAENLSENTRKVWQHHIEAWSQRDIPGILADYTDESLIVVNGRKFRGSQQIGQLFGKLFGVFDRAERHVIDPAVVEPGLVYITWNAKIDGVEHPVGSDTFVIQDGKIVYQTIASDRLIFADILRLEANLLMEGFGPRQK